MSRGRRIWRRWSQSRPVSRTPTRMWKACSSSAAPAARAACKITPKCGRCGSSSSRTSRCPQRRSLKWQCVPSLPCWSMGGRLRRSGPARSSAPRSAIRKSPSRKTPRTICTSRRSIRLASRPPAPCGTSTSWARRCRLRRSRPPSRCRRRSPCRQRSRSRQENRCWAGTSGRGACRPPGGWCRCVGVFAPCRWRFCGCPAASRCG
jgi:hypothetical protein